MDRCAAAYAYHKQGYNCAQSVAGAFADLTGTAPEQLMPGPASQRGTRPPSGWESPPTATT